MKKNHIKIALIPFLMLSLIFVAKAQMTPQEAILKMSCGINVGNSLELTNEGATGRYIQEYYFTDFKAAGFNCVRIPIRWDQHTGTTTPYTINAAWLNRVEQIVDWSLKHGLITIINSHHDDWILNDNSYTATDLARFDSIWSQVANRFKDKSDSLMFEIGNEPNIGISLVDKINASVIPLIRKTNPTRIIVFGSSGTQLSTLKQAKIPVDKYLIASFHTYEPWAFSGEGKGTWGTTAQINVVKAMMKDAAAWQTAHKIPLFMGEFGTVGKCEINSRMKWFYTHVEEAHRYNFGTAVWQDFGNFSVYFNTTTPASKWTTAVKDIIVYTHPLSAESITITVQNKEDAQLTWKNRASDYKWIRIERKISGGLFTSIDTLDGSATSYLDETSILGKTYSYRVFSELSTGEIVCSYPADKKIVATTGIDELNIEGKKSSIDAYFSDDELIIKTNRNNKDLCYNLFTLSGQQILSGILNTNVNHVNTSVMPNGIYLLSIITSDGSVLKRKIGKF